MSDEEKINFYSGKPRLIHIAANIAMAPALLYLVRLWPWPPTIVHLSVFAITTIIAFRYLIKHWHTPRLIIDDKGLYYGEFYPAESICKTESTLKSLTLTLTEGDETRIKVLNLGWASSDDFKAIHDLIKNRFVADSE